VTLRYEIVTRRPGGTQRSYSYAADDELAPGDIVRLGGRDWLVAEAEPTDDGKMTARLVAKPARYRLRLRHPNGREERGALRRYRPGAPRFGHAFSTREDGHPVSWEVVDEGLARDDEGEPYLELVAARDYGELEDLPRHELEHALLEGRSRVPAALGATVTAAEARGEAAELVALEAGEEPDWAAAARFVDALILEEIEDDLLVLCGVDPDADPRDTWLEVVKERLRSDLERFRADIEGDHDQIEEWDYLDGRIFVSVGRIEDEAEPDSGHGWMCRLLDSSVLGAAGFDRVRKPQLEV
jgi:hypothetical protein